MDEKFVLVNNINNNISLHTKTTTHNTHTSPDLMYDWKGNRLKLGLIYAYAYFPLFLLF